MCNHMSAIILVFFQKITLKVLGMYNVLQFTNTAQNMRFSIKDFFSKCDQIWMKLRIWSYLLKKSLIKNFIFMQSKLLWKMKMSLR